MTDASYSPTSTRPSRRGVAFLALCMVIGIAAGWTLHGGATSTRMTTVTTTAGADASSNKLPTSKASSNPVSLKEKADTRAAIFLEQLKAKPGDAQLLTNVGNLYYDAQQYALAVKYYDEALQVRPGDASVRTDYATACWYLGDADKAISEFRRALTYEPNKANTLFNLGMVEWKGKTDAAAALSTWSRLLATNPDYAGKADVEAMIVEVKKDTNR